MSTMPAEMKVAMQEDWKRVESKQSVIDQVAQAILPLSPEHHKYGKIQAGRNTCLSILQALYACFNRNGAERDEAIDSLDMFDDEDYNMSVHMEAVSKLQTRLEKTAEKLHEVTDEPGRKKIHNTHFAPAKFAVLTLELHQLHLRSDAKGGIHKLYFLCYDLAAEREMYAKYLCDNNLLLVEDREALERLLNDVSVWKMGNEMIVEMDKISKNMAGDTYMAKAMKDIEQMKNGEDDKAAEILLVLAGFLDVPNSGQPTVENAVAMLQEKCRSTFDGLKTARGVGMQELRRDKSKFDAVLLATWWGRCAEQFAEFLKGLEDVGKLMDIGIGLVHFDCGPACRPENASYAKREAKCMFVDACRSGGATRKNNTKRGAGGDDRNESGRAQKAPRRGD